MARPRHPNKDLERVLRDLEDEGWRVERRRYFVAFCPCGEHMKTIHLTPSSSGYERNLRAWIQRCPCTGGPTP